MLLFQAGPPPGPPPGPRAVSLLDTLLAGGCIGLLVIACTVLGLVLAAVFLIVFKRRGAILGIALLSVPPIALGLLGTAWAFFIMHQHVARFEAEGASPDPAEIADSRALAMLTTWEGLVGSGLILLFVLLAALVKPREAVAGPPAEGPRRRPPRR